MPTTNPETVEFRLRLLENQTTRFFEESTKHDRQLIEIENSLVNVNNSLNEIKDMLQKRTEADAAKKNWLWKTAGGVLLAAIVGWIIKGGLVL